MKPVILSAAKNPRQGLARHYRDEAGFDTLLRRCQFSSSPINANARVSPRVGAVDSAVRLPCSYPGHALVFSDPIGPRPGHAPSPPFVPPQRVPALRPGGAARRPREPRPAVAAPQDLALLHQ